MVSLKNNPLRLRWLVALANFGFAIFGGVDLALDFRSIVGQGFLTKTMFLAYSIMTGVNMIAALALVAGGVLLLRSNLVAVRFCRSIFLVEIVYSLIVSILWLTPSSDILAAVTNIGNPVIIPQLKTGYPIIALVLLWFAGRR